MTDFVGALAAHAYPYTNSCTSPCTNSAPVCATIVLLHGWGSDSRTWQPILPALQTLAPVLALDLPGFGASAADEEFALESVLASIAAHLPEKCVLIGWSLGGMLAVQLAARYPQKIATLITLAANLKFVASRDYPTAMPLATNRAFNKSFAQDAPVTLKRFGGLLAQGDANERALHKKVSTLAASANINTHWLQALDVLARLDNRAAFAQLTQAGLHLLGEQDVLVPAAAAENMQAANARQTVQVMPALAHALHWSQPELIAQCIQDFLLKDSRGQSDSAAIKNNGVVNSSSDHHRIDKKKMAQSFSRAAQTYDSVANLQRESGETLLTLMVTDHAATTVIDLGSGTGYFTAALQEKCPQAQIVGVDIAEGMLQFSRRRHGGTFSWLCADAETLPLAANSVDYIFSNFAMQWCENVPRLFAELARVLKPGGKLLFTSLGPQTLYELKTAWQQADNYVHVNRFHEQDLLLAGLHRNQLALASFTRATSVLSYEKLTDFTRSLKALGAHNVNQGRALGLQGRQKLAAFKAAYETFRHNGQLPASYDIYTVCAIKQSE